MSDDELIVRVRLRDVPVDGWMRLQEHTDALMREYRLIGQRPDGGMRPELFTLFERVRDLFPRSGVPRFRAAMTEASARGLTTTDAEADVRADQPPLMAELHAVLLDIDEYCRDGTLLTLPLADDVRRLRAWFVEEVTRQVRDGMPPRPYQADPQVPVR